MKASRSGAFLHWGTPMDLLDKLLDASDNNSGMSLSADDVKELLSRMTETEIENERLALTLDHVADVFGAKRSKAVN